MSPFSDVADMRTYPFTRYKTPTGGSPARSITSPRLYKRCVYVVKKASTSKVFIPIWSISQRVVNTKHHVCELPYRFCAINWLLYAYAPSGKPPHCKSYHIRSVPCRYPHGRLCPTKFSETVSDRLPHQRVRDGSEKSTRLALRHPRPRLWPHRLCSHRNVCIFSNDERKTTNAFSLYRNGYRLWRRPFRHVVYLHGDFFDRRHLHLVRYFRGEYDSYRHHVVVECFFFKTRRPIIQAVMITKAMKDKSGIVINPNHAKNLVVHDTPSTQGTSDSESM